MTLSIYDHLLGSSQDNFENNYAFAKQQIAGDAIRRDIADLLNSKQAQGTNSGADLGLCSYGIPDITRFSANSRDDREALRQKIEDVIKRYETRLSDVSVELVDRKDQDSLTCHFAITAVLSKEEEKDFNSNIGVLQNRFVIQ